VERVVAVFDINKDGKISFEEFITGLSKLYGNEEEEKLKFAFKLYNIADDGYISNGELFLVLKKMVGSNLNDV